MATTISRAVRAGAAAAAAAAAGAALWTARPGGPAPGSGPDADVVAAATWAAWLLAGYVVLAVAVTAAGRASDSPAARRLAACAVPATLRRAVEVALGLTVVAGALPTAALADGPPGPPGAGSTASGSTASGSMASGSTVSSPVLAAPTDLDWPGLPAWRPAPAAHPARPGQPGHSGQPGHPDRPPAAPPTTRLSHAAAATTAPPAAAPAAAQPRRDRSADDVVVVRPGDTLWAIAAAHLPAGSTPAQIAAEWPAWWAANRAVIGADPQLIRPGQHLQPPTADPRSPR